MKIETANQMSVQELCDFAVERIVVQGERSGFLTVMNLFVCTYGKKGANAHCGIGWMLDPDNPELMGFPRGLLKLLSKFPDQVPQGIKENIPLFMEFQKFHDVAWSAKRAQILLVLHLNYGLNTDNPAYQQWVDMGKAA